MADIAGLIDSCDLGWDEADVNTLLLDIADDDFFVTESSSSSPPRGFPITFFLSFLCCFVCKI